MPARKHRQRSSSRLLGPGRYNIETLEPRVLLTGVNEQALLNAIDSALQPGSTTGLSAFNSLLKGSAALGTNLPVVGGGMSAYDPGAALSTLLTRLGPTYTSVSSLVAALQNGSGVTVTSSSDLLDNIELDVQFSATSIVSVPLDANYGVSFADPGTLSMSTTLSESLTLGAYWDASISSAVFYLNANNSSIQVASSVKSVSAQSGAQLGFIQLSGGISTASFSPTFSFTLNDQPPVDSAEAAGRLTLSQLTSVPLASLVTTQLTQPAAATVTANISTPQAPSAHQIVFTWPDINAPSTVSSTLTTDPTLAQLNQLQTISPLVISDGLDEVTEDLAAAATNDITATNPFSTDLPLLGESLQNLVDFPITSAGSGTYSIFQTYLTNFTDPVTSATDTSTEPFTSDQQLLTLIQGIHSASGGAATIKSLTETSSGSQLIFSLGLDVTIPNESAAPITGLDVSPQLNFNYSAFPSLTPTVGVNVDLSFGVDASTGKFFVTAGTTPAVQVNVSAAGTLNGPVDLGLLDVAVTGGSFQLQSTANVTLSDPQTDVPPTPGIITSNELVSTNLAKLATLTMTGTASASLPISVYSGGLVFSFNLAPETIAISWPDVFQPTTYTFNTSALGSYLALNNLTTAELQTALTQLGPALNDLSDSSALGQNIAFIGTNLADGVSLGTKLEGDIPSFTDLQSLYAGLQGKVGASGVSLTSTSAGVVLGIGIGQQLNESLGWSVDDPVDGAEFQASGTVPDTASYYADVNLGISLTAAATPANQFFLQGGPDFGGQITVNTGLNGTAALGNASLTIGEAEAEVAASDSNPSSFNLNYGVPATFAGSIGASGEQISLTSLAAKPDSFFGSLTFSGGAVLAIDEISGLPNPGSNPGIDFVWSNLGQPASLKITPTNLGNVSTTTSYNAKNFLSGIGSFLTSVGTWQNSSILETDLFLLDQPINKVINYIGDFQSVLQQIDSLPTSTSATTLDQDIKNAPQAAGFTTAQASITPTANDSPGNNQFEYTLKFDINEPISPTVPFALGAGEDSLFSLQANVPVTASFNASVTFGFDAADGFYVVGGNGSSSPQINLQVGATATFASQVTGTFGMLPIGVSNGSANMSASVGLDLLAPGDNGQKISSMDLAKGGQAILQPTITGSGSINLPFGFRLGSSGPGVISSYSASWNPSQTPAIEYGASDSSNPADGFGGVYFDYTEFVADMLGPVLQNIQQYDPIPPELLNALNYQIPVIDMTPAQILESQGDYSDNDDVSTLLNILSIIGDLPTGNKQLDLSQYLPGSGGTPGDFGTLDGASDGSSTYSDFQDFVNMVQSDDDISLPALSDPQTAIIDTLLGQDVTLISFDPGPFNLTASYNVSGPSIPVFDLGFASVNVTFGGGVSVTLSGDINVGLTTRGLLGNDLSHSVNLLDGFYIDDSAPQQISLSLNAYVTITGSLDLGGFLSVASITGSLGPYGSVGVRVNSLVPNSNNTGYVIDPTTGFYEIAGYDGAPAGNGMAYLDEIGYIANTYNLLCAVMPEASFGLQLTVSATVGYPPLGFSWTLINQQFPIANFDYPCEPQAATLAQVEGNSLVILPNVLDTSDGTNTISAAVYDSATGQPAGIAVVESNKSQILYQDFTFSQLTGVNTVVMNGTDGDDKFNFDPNLTLASIMGQYVIPYLQINSLGGNDSVKLNNLTAANSNLQYLTIDGGSGNDFFEGTYAPELITLGSGANTVVIGTGNGKVIESSGQDSISGANGNDTVEGGSGAANITLGDGNNVVQESNGSAQIVLGNGNNLVTDSSLSYGSGISANGSSITSGSANAPEGTQAGFIQGNSSISQLVSGWQTSNGYTLSFSAAEAANNAGSENFEVLIDNQVVGTFDPTSTTYQVYTTPAFTVSSNGPHLVTFRGLDPTNGDNTVLIDNVQNPANTNPFVTPNPSLVIANGGFESPALAAGSFVENDIAPSPDDLNLSEAEFDNIISSTGWTFIAGVGTDSVVAGNGNNTINGDTGGSTIFVGDGQDIIYASGSGSNFINAGGLSGQDSTHAGGGNDFIDINPAAGGAYTVNGGGGKTLLEVQADANVTLNNKSVTVGANSSSPDVVQFTNIASVSLTGEGGSIAFDVSAWTGAAPVQINGGGGNDSIVSTDDTNFILGDNSLTRSDGTSFALSGIGTADLTGGASDNSFDVSDWHGGGVLTGNGGNDSLVAGSLTTATLSDSLLQRTGAGNLTLDGIGQVNLSASPLGGANINASAFSGDAALLGQGNHNSLIGGNGSDYIVGGTGMDNMLVGNGTTDNEIIGGTGSDDTIQGGAGENLLVGSGGGGDLITTGSGESHVYTPGNNTTVNAQGGNAIVYAGSAGDAVNTGTSTTDQVLHPGAAGTVASDFTAPSTGDLWEFPTLPVPPSATLPTGTASLGQWVEYGTSASGGGVSNSPGSAIDPSIVATGSGSTAVQYVAWADDRGGTYEIYVAEDTSSGWEELAGSAQGGGISNSTANSSVPSITLDSSGNPIVAWTESNNIYVADYSPAANGGLGGWVALGSSLSAGGISNTNHAGTAKIVETSTGPVVAWLDSSSGAANIYVKSFNGTTWSPLGTGAASGTGVSASATSVSGLSLATDGSKVAVAWTQMGTSAAQSIYLLQYAGSSWTALGGSASGTGISGTFASQMPSIAYASGSIYAAWAANTDGTTNIVAASSTGATWTPISIETPASAGTNQVSRGAASDPVLSANGSSLDLVWIEDRLPAVQDQAVAIYANRLVSGAFVYQLPGDSSFDGILGHSTSLSQPAVLALAVDGAGHPYAAWGDSSSGSDQVYMLGDTLNVHQIIYVNDAVGPDDSYTTTAGATSNTGLLPSSPLASIQAALSLATSPGDVILVDSGTYAGFTAGAASNGMLIIGSPDGTTDITGAVSVAGAGNVTLQWMEFSSGASLSGDTGIELNNDTGGAAADLAHLEGGSVSITGSTGITLDDVALVGVSLGGASSGITVINSSLPGTGLAIGGTVTGLLVSNNRLASLTLDASTQGVIDANNISGGGVTIDAGVTGSIYGNFIHGAPVGVTYNNAAPLNNNQIFDNKTGVAVGAGSGGLGYFGGSSSNYIVNNGTGVQLAGLMQGQYISHNDTGVTGSGVLGGTSLANANQIEDNTKGVNFTGTVQYNRIDYNGTSIVVQNGQLIAHNLIYDNNGPNLQTLGASNVEIINNSFFSPNQTNVMVNDGSSDVEILNDILWTGGGYDIDVDNVSRTGFFSDYNDLYTTGSGQIVHYLVDFDDILDWQDDVALYDLHSIGTTVVNPTAAQPQFVDLGFGDFSVFPAAAGLRKTSPTIATGDPEIDLALPTTEYTNLLVNPSFESGTSSWTVNPGGTTQSGSPAAFDGSSYFYSGAVASGFAQQTINLLSDGYTAAQIDAGDLDVSFGGRIRSAAETTPDQGQLVLTFLDGSGNAIGSPTLLSASNTTDRWELVGARVHVPVGARSVTYRFQNLRESGSTDDSYLDAAFLFVLVNTVATDIGAYGASYDTAEEPVDEKIQLQTPDLYVNWTVTQSHEILWSTFGNTGDDPVKIDLYQQTSSGLEFLLNITPSTPDTGSYAWIPQDSGLPAGTTYDLRIEVSLVGQPAIQDMSTENFTVVPATDTTYYINDSSTTGDQYSTAAGNNRATGLLPSAPLPLLTTLLRTYTLGAEDTVYVDTGTYYDFAPVELSGNPAVGSGQGVTIIGPTQTGDTATINALGFTSPAVIDVNDASFVTISHIGVAGGNYGIWVRNASTNFTGSYLTATNNLLGGIRIEADSTTAATLNYIVTDDNTGDGLYAGGPIVSLTNSMSFNNAGDGFDLANSGAAVLTDDIAYGNTVGLNVANSTSGTTTIIGNANLALGLGNQFYNNSSYGIYTNGSVLLEGNSVYGQTTKNAVGINLNGGQTATENLVYNNYTGINAAASTITYNSVYGNSNVGIESDAGGTVTGNVVYQNGIGIQSVSAPNSSQGPYLTNNLVYYNAVQGIVLIGGNSSQIYNNTVYQLAGDAISVNPAGSLNSVNIQIENNILWTQDGFDLAVNPASENGFNSDYNDLYFTGTGEVGEWDNLAEPNLQDWIDASTNDADSISTDPLFVNVAGDDFHVQSTTGSFHGGSLAPMIGASGLPVSDPGTLTADPSESPTIDRGNASFSFANEPSPNGGFINLGSTGNTPQASLSPTSYVLVLKPGAGSTVIEGQNFTITWRSQDMTGTANIDLLQGSTVVMPIAAGVPNNGGFAWAVPTSLMPGNYTIRVTRNSAPTAIGISGGFTLSAPITNYYVNDSATGGVFTTAGGSDSNSGLDPAHPKATIQALLSAYTIGANSIIYVDEGTYNLTSNIVLTAANSGITIEGVPGGGTVINRGDVNVGAYDFDLQTVTGATLENLTIGGGYYGINASYNNGYTTDMTVMGCTFLGDYQAGINVQNNNTTGYVQTGDVITDDTFVSSAPEPVIADNTFAPNPGPYAPNGPDAGPFSPYPWSVSGGASLVLYPPTVDGIGQGVVLPNQGAVSQTISGWGAGSYSLNISAAQAPQGNNENFEVLIDSTVVADITPTSTTFQTYGTNEFVVLAGTHTITIQGLDSAGGSNTALITSVSFALLPTNLVGVQASGVEITLSNNIAHNLNYGFEVSSGDGSTVSGNTAYNNNVGISAGTAVVTGNIAYGNTDGILFGGTTLSGNTSYNNTSIGINISSGTASGNISYGNAYGVEITGNATVSDDLIYDNTSAGITGGNGSNILGNVLYGNGVGISISSDTSAADGGPVVENNLVYNNITAGMVFSGSDVTPILNNTIYQTGGVGLEFANTGTNQATIRDNIIWDIGGMDVEVPVSAQQGVAFDYNDLYTTGGGQIGEWGTQNASTLLNWQSISGMDPNSISADPLFVNAAGGDFHEQSTTGSFHGGSLAPTLNTATGLPNPAKPGTLTADANESPAIDRGDPIDPYSNEPSPNGGYVNIGAYGNTAQASLSPVHFLFVVNPTSVQTVATGQPFVINWRDEVSNTSAGKSDTVDIAILPQGSQTPADTYTSPDVGTYTWMVPTSLAAGTYVVQITRTDGTGIVALSSPFQVASDTGSYYVNGSSTGGIFTTAGGNITNSGLSPNSPKPSIAAILSSYTLTPGSTIYVDEGTYTLSGNIVLTAAENGITIEGVPGGATILNRNNTGSGGTSVFQLDGVSNVTLSNLTITGANMGIEDTSGATNTSVTVNTCYIAGNAYGIYLNNGADPDFTLTGSTIDNNSFDTFQSRAITNLTVTNNTFFDGRAISGVSANGGLISGNIYDDYPSTGNDEGPLSITGSGNQVLVTNNMVYGNSGIGMSIGGTVLATGNTVYGNTSIGIYITGGEAENNIVYGNATGISISSGQFGSAIANNNTVYDNSGDGISAGNGDTVTGNDVYSNGSYGIQAGLGFGSITVISNNLVYANTAGGIYVSGGYAAQVTGNTVYQQAGDAFKLDGTSSSPSATQSGVSVENNIFWTTAGPDLMIADSAETGFFSDYNDLYATGTGEIAQMGTANFTSLANWAFELGLDIDSISANPQFVNMAGPDGLLGYVNGTNHGADDDFHVQPTSPTIDAGNPASDYLAEPAPNGARVNLGYDGDTSAAAPSSAATTVQVTEPTSLQDLQVGTPYTIQWITSGLLSTQTLTEVAAGEPVAVGEFHADEFQTGSIQNAGSNGSTINTSLVTNPASQTVYQHYATAATGVGNSLSYLIPAANGTYTIRLEFVEPNVNSATGREFDILLQGNVVQSAFSIYSAAGNALNKAVDLTFTVTATGGTGISLQLNNDTSNPAILNAFEISQANAGGSASPTANVQVSTDGGNTWTTIATNQPLDLEGHGSVVWTPTTQTSGPTALVRVIANNAAATTGVSGPFLIANSGNSFYVNGTYTPGDVYTTASGNNANSGKSPNAPMASIEAVINTYHPGAGDTIYVDSGTYNLFHDIDIQLQDSGLTIQGPTSGAPAVLNRGNTSDNVFYLVPAVMGITIENLSITGADYGINSPEIENPPVASSNITIENDQIYSNFADGIIAGLTYNWTIVGNVIHDNNQEGNDSYGIALSSCTGTILNNTVYNEQTGIFFTAPVSSAFAPANVIGNNTVYADGTGIYASDVLVSGNTAHDNSLVGINASSYSVVTGNTAYRQTAANAIGIEINTGTASNNLVYGNYNGMLVESGQNIFVYGNRIYSNANYGLLIENDTAAPSVYVQTAYDNIIYANATGGIFITSSANFSLTNNTVYQLIGDAINLSSSSNITIENNILWVEAGYDLDIATTGQTGLISDYNILYHLGANARVGTWNGTAQSTLAAWQSASSEDAHSSEANPMFVNPAGADAVLGYNATANNGDGYNGGTDDDFYLLEGSPAIDSGSSWIGYSTDINGASRYDDPATANTGSNDFYPAVQSSSLFNATSGTAENWRAGTPTTFSFTLPFAFPFYGTNYTGIYVSSTGVIRLGSFQSPDPAASSANSDAALLANPLIAPLWGNLETNQTGDNIFVDTTVPNQVTIRWAATNIANGLPVNFAVVLFSNGQIRFDYGSGNTGLTPTVGISKGDGQHDKLTSYDGQSTLTNANSILFSLAPGYVDMGAYEYRGANQEFTSPKITSASNATFTFGQLSSFTVTTTFGFPTSTTLSETGELPPGLIFEDNGNGTATISGSPIGAANGAYTLTLTAANGSGTPILSSTQVFDLTVSPATNLNVIWTGAGDGMNWGNAANWSDDAVPTAADNVFIPAGVPALTATGSYSVGSLTTASSITVVGGSLTVDGQAAFNGAAVSGNFIDNGSVIIDYSSDPSFSANISGSGALTVDGPGTVELTGVNTYIGPTTVQSGMLVIGAAGSLPVGNSVAVDAGAVLQLASNIGTLTVSSLTIYSGGTVDITNNSLIIDFGSGSDPASTIRGYLVSGRGPTGNWQGTGLTSSAAAADPSIYTIGYADGGNAADLATVHGLTPGEVEVKYTVAGDVNLSGGVDLSDLVIIASDFGKTGADWTQGDVNYDGNVDLSDLVIVASNFGAAVSNVTWTGAGDGMNWSNPANWSDDAVPTVANNVIIPAGVAALTVSGSYSVGSLTTASSITVAGGSFTLEGPGVFNGRSLTIDGGATLYVDNGGSLTGNLVDNGGVIIDFTSDPNFSANISGSGSLTVDGPGTVDLTGLNSYSGPTAVQSGTLVIGAASSLPTGNSLAIDAGAMLQLASNIGTLTVSSLTIQPGGTVDITNNSLIINFGSGADPAAAIRGYLVNGRGQTGNWQGTGLTSSAAAADPSAYAIGYADGGNTADLATVHGLTPGEVEVKYTVAGDANLSGSVDLSDLVIIASDFGKTGTDWTEGDLNYDGNVDLSDLVIVASNFGASAASTNAADTVVADTPVSQSPGAVVRSTRVTQSETADSSVVAVAPPTASDRQADVTSSAAATPSTVSAPIVTTPHPGKPNINWITKPVTPTNADRNGKQVKSGDASPASQTPPRGSIYSTLSAGTPLSINDGIIEGVWNTISQPTGQLLFSNELLDRATAILD
jgi:autotransporter-associated beta strand protein